MLIKCKKYCHKLFKRLLPKTLILIVGTFKRVIRGVIDGLMTLIDESL
jgi:hypothetical protein